LVVNEKMKLDEGRRELLEKKKETERQDAIKMVFSDSDTSRKQAKIDSSLGDATDDIEKKSILENNEAQLNSKTGLINQKPTKKVNEIWDESTISDQTNQHEHQTTVTHQLQSSKLRMVEGDPEELVPKSKVLPAVRNITNQESVKLEFTEKIFPTLALRESQFKEAPAPKLRKLAKKMDQVLSINEEPRKHYQKPNLAKGQGR
jgi:hypothetical protein